MKNKLNEGSNINKKESHWVKMKKYGIKGLKLYTFSYIAVYLGIYILLHKNYIDKNKITEFSDKLGLTNHINIDKWLNYYDPKYTNLVIAWVLTEFTDVVRIPFILFILKKLYK
jgi:hypothetical protein